MKKYLFLLLLPTLAFAGGSHHEKPPKPTEIPPASVVVPPVIVSTSLPSSTSTAPPVSNGGWNGGCSTFAEGQLPWWGKVPCNPTSPTQPPAVTPQSLAHPMVVKLSDMPYTGYSPSLPQYLWDLFVGFFQ